MVIGKQQKMENFGDFLPTIFARDRSRRRQLNHSLASRMRLTGFNAQHGYAPGKTTTRFNYVIAPKHDELEGSNIIQSLGAIHQFTKETIENYNKDIGIKYSNN